jgi:CBS domain-containing protein
MKVADVMTQEVRSVTADVSLKEVASLLAEYRISGVPVLDGDRVVGVVSEGDILFKERGRMETKRGGVFGWLGGDRSELDAKLQAATAGEAMTSPALTVTADRPVEETAATMIDKGVNRLPVVDDQGRLVGIVTRADLVRAFIRSDDQIAREIREDVVLRKLWVAPETLSVSVTNGEVTIAGQVETKNDVDLLVEFVRRVPGVVSVTSTVTPVDDAH